MLLLRNKLGNFVTFSVKGYNKEDLARNGQTSKYNLIVSEQENFKKVITINTFQSQNGNIGVKRRHITEVWDWSCSRFKGWVCNVWRVWEGNSDIEWLHFRLQRSFTHPPSSEFPSELRQGNSLLVYWFIWGRKRSTLYFLPMEPKCEYILLIMFSWVLHWAFNNIKIPNQAKFCRQPLRIQEWKS